MLADRVVFADKIIALDLRLLPLVEPNKQPNLSFHAMRAAHLPPSPSSSGSRPILNRSTALWRGGHVAFTLLNLTRLATSDLTKINPQDMYWPDAASPAALCGGLVVVALGWLFKAGLKNPLPCPSTTLPVLGNTFDMMIQLPRLHDWISEQCLQHKGKTWAIHMLWAPSIVVVSSAALFEDVWKTQFANFGKGDRTRRIFADVSRHNILSLDGDQWKQQRRIMNNLFTMRRFRETIVGAIQKHLLVFDRVLANEVARQPREDSDGNSEDFYDLGDAFHRFSFDVFANIAFGLEENKLEGTGSDIFIQALSTGFRTLMVRFLEPEIKWRVKRFLNIGTERELRNAVQIADEKLLSIISNTLRRKLEEPTPHSGDGVRQMDEHTPGTDHIVSLAIESGNEAMTDVNYLRAIGLAVITAGMDTSSIALSWLVITLAQHPHVLEKLRGELRARFPQLFSDRTYVPDMKDIESLVYLEAIVRESLRLTPVSPLSTSEAMKDTTLCDGTFLKKGSVVYLPMYALARMPSIWGPDADSFNPERWLDSNSASPDSPQSWKLRTFPAYQFVSFGGGPRICVGMRYAMMNLKVTVAYLFSKYDLTPTKVPASYTYKTGALLSLEDSLLVRVTTH